LLENIQKVHLELRKQLLEKIEREQIQMQMQLQETTTRRDRADKSQASMIKRQSPVQHRGNAQPKHTVGQG